ncbi:hypothetical protein BDV97DRAFT_414109 [Delphinella strobiligena]|nr:hypothetical protein BDV97DRAFT_414109 [Delphinella strobiligena]
MAPCLFLTCYNQHFAQHVFLFRLNLLAMLKGALADMLAKSLDQDRFETLRTAAGMIQIQREAINFRASRVQSSIGAACSCGVLVIQSMLRVKISADEHIGVIALMVFLDDQGSRPLDWLIKLCFGILRRPEFSDTLFPRLGPDFMIHVFQHGCRVRADDSDPISDKRPVSRMIGSKSVHGGHQEFAEIKTCRLHQKVANRDLDFVDTARQSPIARIHDCIEGDDIEFRSEG